MNVIRPSRPQASALATLAVCFGLNACGAGTSLGPAPVVLHARGGAGGTATVTGPNSGTFSVPPLDPACGGPTDPNFKLCAFAQFQFSDASIVVGLPLSKLGPISFDWSGTGATGGSPRFSIPYTIGNSSEVNATSGATNCPSFTPTLTSGTVASPACDVYDGSGRAFPSFAALVAANPGAIVSSPPFVIADEPGNFTITNIRLGE